MPLHPFDMKGNCISQLHTIFSQAVFLWFLGISRSGDMLHMDSFMCLGSVMVMMSHLVYILMFVNIRFKLFQVINQ